VGLDMFKHPKLSASISHSLPHFRDCYI